MYQGIFSNLSLTHNIKYVSNNIYTVCILIKCLKNDSMSLLFNSKILCVTNFIVMCEMTTNIYFIQRGLSNNHNISIKYDIKI